MKPCFKPIIKTKKNSGFLGHRKAATMIDSYDCKEDQMHQINEEELTKNEHDFLFKKYEKDEHKNKRPVLIKFTDKLFQDVQVDKGRVKVVIPEERNSTPKLMIRESPHVQSHVQSQVL